MLLEEDFADAVGSERAVLVGVESFLVFNQRAGEVALAHKLLTTKDGDFHGEVWSGLEHPGLGVDGDAARAAEGLDRVAGVSAGDVDAADFGFAFGLNAELDGHAEEVEILRDGADGAEALVVAEAVDGVFVRELRGAGAVDPLGEEGAEVGHIVADSEGGILDIAGADGFVGVLGEQAAEHAVKGFVAELPAEHMEDHGSFFEGHGLELGRKGVEAAHGGEGLGVIGQGAGGDVADRGLEGTAAGGVFEVEKLGVATHAVGDPGVVEGCGRDLGAEPLVGEGIGEQAGGGVIDDAVAGDGCKAGTPGGGDGVLRQLDDVHLGGFGLAEGRGHELELFRGERAELEGTGFVLSEGVEVEVRDVLGCDELAGDNGSRETGLGPVESVLGFGPADGLGGARGSGTDDALVGGHGDVHLGGEAVGVEAGLRHGEPAAGVEQDGDGVGDGDELDAFDGAGFGGGRAGVVEGPGNGGALGDGVGEGDADGVLRGEALGGEGLVFVVGDAGDGEAVVELEGGGGEVFEGGEGDDGGGGELSGFGVEVGLDVVGGDFELRARGRGEGRGCGEEEGEGAGKFSSGRHAGTLSDMLLRLIRRGL